MRWLAGNVDDYTRTIVTGVLVPVVVAFLYQAVGYVIKRMNPKLPPDPVLPPPPPPRDEVPCTCEPELTGRAISVKEEA